MNRNEKDTVIYGADGKRDELSNIPLHFISQKSPENLLRLMKKLPLFVENVSWHLNLKADILYYWVN